MACPTMMPCCSSGLGPQTCRSGKRCGPVAYSSRCRELLYLLAGQLYRQGDSDTLLNYQAELSPLADLSSLAGKPLLSVVAYKKAPLKAVLDSSAPQFDIKVKTLTGQWLPFKVRGNMLVEEFKGMVEDAEGIPPGQQRHIFKGIHLQDGRTMSDYGVESAAAELAAQGQVPVLLLMLPLRGGMYHQTSGRHDNESMSAEPLTQR
ncbi:hypothetical protein OEZ85_006046 [Tetradesmus obliquus]|uniref:Ubiquitin-like domain-containing protein n=1 Tax=Tetradesmus obliquus TaxID=3088 RepID=A0ABY8UFC3_TETOB|nr:hypothetical protein OEZ85_006046 [Tetradesmus obliquus]